MEYRRGRISQKYRRWDSPDVLAFFRWSDMHVDPDLEDRDRPQGAQAT